VVLCNLDLQAADNARSNYQPVYQVSFGVEILLLHFELMHVQELAVEVSVTNGRDKIG
jgi:hypothetical protein